MGGISRHKCNGTNPPLSMRLQHAIADRLVFREITPTLKVRRKIVAERYSSDVDALYAQKAVDVIEVHPN